MRCLGSTCVRKSEISATFLEIGDFCYFFGNRRFLLLFWKSEISATFLEIGDFCYFFGNRRFLLLFWKSEISATLPEILMKILKNYAKYS
ncbi:MAG: hypothetical protein FWG98_12830 [Candidatus Cloacimonetes bacterium]|nr:hypothetical protein [Candidatus Cloacimonadota bacterium]